jgi:hypothetical protein
MVQLYAVVKDALVVNTIMWDGVTPCQPPEGCEFVAVGDSGAGIGWSYVNGQFIPPPPEPDQA